MEPYVDSKYDLYIQKIGSNYRTFVYVLPVLFVCCCLSRPTEASCDGSMLVDVTSGREVGAINWTQEPKSVWDGPTSKATGHAPRPARDWPVPKSPSVQAYAQTGTAGHCAVQRSWPVRTFSKSATLHCFPNFYTLIVEIFRNFFRLRLPMTSVNDEKFHGNRSARFSEIRKTDRHTHTHTHRRGSFIYIDSRLAVLQTLVSVLRWL